MTIQQKLKQTMESCGLPYKRIDVCGITHSTDYAKENKNTCLLPTTVEVWRTFGVI